MRGLVRSVHEGVSVEDLIWWSLWNFSWCVICNDILIKYLEPIYAND